jgi:hypothetical protein
MDRGSRYEKAKSCKGGHCPEFHYQLETQQEPKKFAVSACLGNELCTGFRAPAREPVQQNTFLFSEAIYENTLFNPASFFFVY